jgi:TonB family protein
MAGSFGAHALLLLLLILMPRALPQAPALTEFTLLDPGELEAASGEPSLPSRAAATNPGALTTGTRDESFERTSINAEIEPHPQAPEAIADRLSARLASLQNVDATRAAGVAEARIPGNSGLGAVPSTVGGGPGAAVNLTRGGALGAPPSLSLSRGGGGTSPAPALVAVRPAAEKSAVSGAATPGETSARRSLSGVSLAGPIADRPVLSYRKPVYPDWAKRDLVEGSVTLYFIVRPDGSVKENVLVQRTAGFEDFDESARLALRAWRFAPLVGGRTGEQWGTITFHFRMQEAG